MSSSVVAAQIVNRPAHDIKRKFFDTIGIAGTCSSESSSQDTAASNDITFSRCYGVTVFQEKLKLDSRNDSRQQTFLSGSTNACRHRTSKKGKCLTFNESVEVVPIPMRNEYSTRVRSRLWSGAVELHENAVRNSIEFASEGYVPIIIILSTF
jgi:hypothetical protein